MGALPSFQVQDLFVFYQKYRSVIRGMDNTNHYIRLCCRLTFDQGEHIQDAYKHQPKLTIHLFLHGLYLLQDLLNLRCLQFLLHQSHLLFFYG